MPLERRVQPPRTYQRTYRGNTRTQPYSLPARLSGGRSRDVAVDLDVAEGDAQQRIPFTPLAKRSAYGTCTCSTRNEPMQTDDAYSDTELGNETEETQRMSPNQWTQTNGNQSSWPLEGNSRLTSSFLNRTSQSWTEIRNVNSGLSDPPESNSESLTNSDNLLSSMIPSTVPISNSSNIISNLSSPDAPQPVSRSADRVEQNRAVSDCPSIDAIQNAPVLSQSSSEDLHNVVNPEEYSNHDRSLYVVQGGSACRIASLRVSRSMATMPPPSAHARQVATRLIRHARANKTPDERSLWCPHCARLPLLPVTGQCGHTRCTKCIQDHGKCPCGVQAPKNLHVNTLIQDLIRKMLPSDSCTGAGSAGDQTGVTSKQPHRASPVTAHYALGGSCRQRSARAAAAAAAPDVSPQKIMTPEARFELARRLVSSGRPRAAAPHLARVAASSDALARIARPLLAQTITALSFGRDPRRLTRELYRAVRAQSAASWLKPTDLECVLCYHAYTSPVCTPCGHTYCRTCIERSMDYRKSCALCLRSLEDFDLAATRETAFICSALASIDALSPPQPPDPDVIPIFVCTVAYPAIPCPLFIFDPRYWLMIRRVLESGSRKFGMVAYERDRTYSDYGTVLEVCDCVHLEDGRSILSTVGVSRFRVIERDVRDGCDVARIQPLTDITPTEELVIWELRIMATQISYKALLWLNSMDRTVRAEIETAFGRLPQFDHRQEHWWDSPDGPAWLWWLIAILPLRSEIKILILSTKNLLKRMMAVSRTLEAIDQVSLSATVTSECANELRSALTNTEEWLQRSA